ncbi:MAG: hypothetical protein CMJ34_01460 [Phycisphaerae bacterium]|nr:hypothetical protein [Phycisphaerae bacterium]
MSDRGFVDRIKHAFGVEDPEDFAPTEKQKAAVEKICREIVRRGMTLPASMLLEMSRPLNYIGAQAMHFFTPFATVLVDGRSWEDFASFVERRGSVEYLIRTIEDCEREARSAEDEAAGVDEGGSAEAVGEGDSEPGTDSGASSDESDDPSGSDV